MIDACSSLQVATVSGRHIGVRKAEGTRNVLASSLSLIVIPVKTVD
jgi:hypothetical protein